MADGEVVSNDPVIAPLPTPISVEPRTASPAEAAEIARQAEEAKLPKEAAKPVEKEAASEAKKPLSTREALRAAREKVEAPVVAEKASPLKTEPKAAEPVAAKEAAKTEPVAKVDPKAAEPVKSEPAARGEDGKFVSTKAAEPGANVESVPTKAAEPVVAAKAALPSHTAEPAPKRFSAEAKEEWAALPEKSRAEVARMERELTAGFEKHRAAAARDADLVEFHDLAAKGNTTVKEALGKYIGMEQLLRSNPDKGLEAIFQNVGISPREWATKLLGTTPDAAASQQDATIRELNAKIARLEQGFGTLHQERAQAKTDTTTETVTKFAADHPRFEELSEDIAFFLKTRTKDLAEAYSLAERLNPAPAAQAAAPEPAPASSAPAVTKPTLVPASSAGQKSIAGAPTAGSDPARKQTSSSIKEALKRARQAVA